MRANFALLTLAICITTGIARASVQSTPGQCPVVLDHIELSYSHQQGQSKPQLRVNFGNAAGKRISTVTLTLSLLDSNGYPRPYPDDLVYRGGLEAGKERAFTWDLTPESIDIHRSGETVLVQEVEFADNTSWKDDGSESCILTVDFHAK
jgi:hypothetical protein